MDKETEETVIKAVDYSNIETETYAKRINCLLTIGAILWIVAQIISHTSLQGLYAFSALADFSEGAACGLIIVVLIMSTRQGQKIHTFKERALKKY